MYQPSSAAATQPGTADSPHSLSSTPTVLVDSPLQLPGFKPAKATPLQRQWMKRFSASAIDRSGRNAENSLMAYRTITIEWLPSSGGGWKTFTAARKEAARLWAWLVE